MKLAVDAGLRALSIHSYVESLQAQYPDLAERLAVEGRQQDAAESRKDGQESGQKPGSRRHLFHEHKPMSELTAGIRQGR